MTLFYILFYIPLLTFLLLLHATLQYIHTIYTLHMIKWKIVYILLNTSYFINHAILVKCSLLQPIPRLILLLTNAPHTPLYNEFNSLLERKVKQPETILVICHLSAVHLGISNYVSCHNVILVRYLYCLWVTLS